MSAREDLIDEVRMSLTSGDFLYMGDAEADATAMVDAFAHELAEYLRSWRDDCRYEENSTQYMVMSGCANLIDPEVEN